MNNITIPTNLSLDEVEQLYTLVVLRDLDGNRTHTARVLKITVRTLRNRLERYRQLGYQIPESKCGRSKKLRGYSE